MINSALHLVEDDESDEPPPLEQLADSLAHIRNINHSAVVRTNEYDNSVSILLMLRRFRQAKGYGGHEVFRVYDPDKEVSERNVADNKKFIADSMKHPRCYMQIRKFLESLGYQHFHNPYSDYTSKRFHEHIKDNKIGIYSAKVL
ncbi:hypothetical protein KY343_05940 [Candidatus Woesearchaeota archaeon]|nr:hypothetical protein [Candidatus Woesearchaeota archaeon]